MATIEVTLLRQSSSYLRMVFLVVALGWATPQARAETLLPDAIYTSHQSGNCIVELGGAPSPFAHVFASAGPGGLAGGDASATYYFAVDGPTAGISVPLQMNTFVSYDVVGVSTGNPASFYLVAGTIEIFPASGVQITQVFGEAGFGGPLSDHLSTVFNFTVTTGVANKIIVAALAGVNNSAVGVSSTVDAVADPVISFGPGFDSTGLSLEFSPGIGNSLPSSAVPAPSTLVMSSILFGMFGVAWSLKRLRQTTVAA